MTSTPRTIEITIRADGQTKLETKGFAGPSCREASRQLERALGLVASDRPTAEMHQSADAHVDQQTRA